jgi:hypothetical protein
MYKHVHHTDATELKGELMPLPVRAPAGTGRMLIVGLRLC